MIKKIFLLSFFVLLMTSVNTYADQGLYLVQFVQPEKQRIDIKFYSFFFLNAQEQSALIKLANQHTLYTYQELVNKDQTLQKKIGPVTVLMKAQPLGQKGRGGSEPGIEVSVLKDKHKILDKVIFKSGRFEKVSVLYKDDTVILSLTCTDSTQQIENYEIKTNLDKSINSYDDIKS